MKKEITINFTNSMVREYKRQDVLNNSKNLINLASGECSVGKFLKQQIQSLVSKNCLG